VADAPRYLARRSQDGYTTSPVMALKGEPEAVSEDEQALLTESARKRVLDDRIRRRQATSEEIRRELDHVEARARYLQRELRRLQRKQGV
jgi:hypothetical protein